MANRKKPPTSDPSDPGTTLLGLMWMRPAPGELEKGLAALRREREEREYLPPKTAKRASISIACKIARMRTFLVPFPAGLAPETLDFVAALNAEADRYGIEIAFATAAHWIEATGSDLEEAAKDPTTLIGWFLRLGDGYLGSQTEVRRKANSERRKYLRKYAKTKAGIAEAAKIEAEVERQAAFIRDVAARHSQFYEMIRTSRRTNVTGCN
jgi:hypothetical protein